MKKILFFLAALVLIPASQANAQFIDTSSLFNYQLVQTQELCENKGGYWNACTLNACQKAQKNTSSDTICSQECGPSICEWPESANGPYSELTCEQNGGSWNTCPMNECEKNGGTQCGVNCGKAVCEFTSPPTNQTLCNQQGGTVIFCPRLLECDKNNAEICPEVCGKDRCRILSENENSESIKACEALDGWWNTQEKACEFVMNSEETITEENT